MIYADNVFYNGKIYTMEAPGETVGAVVVRDGKILFAGTDAEALAYPAKETVDLGGHVGLPGLSDTHIHLFMDCESQKHIVLSEARNISELVGIMRARDDGGDDWLVGADVSMADLEEKRYPTRYELDRISTTRPILIFSHCLHISMANSVTLRLAGVTKEKVAGDACLTFYEDGEPDGIIKEAAYVKYITDLIEAKYEDAAYRNATLTAHIGSYPRKGYTTLHAISGLAGAPPMEMFDQYCALEREGALPVRVVVNSVYLPTRLNPLTGFGTDMVKVGAKKIFMDGSLGGRTAAMAEPYADAPTETGGVFYTPEETVALLKEAYDRGVEAAVHAIGDAAMEQVISAAERVYPASDEPDPAKRLAAAGVRRLRIIHASVFAPGHVARMRRLPILLDVQPNFIDSDGVFVPDRLGPVRTARYMPLKSCFDAGILLTGGSDAPVDHPQPFTGIECAVTRKGIDGRLPEGLAPEEGLSVYDAVCMYTRNAAFCSGEERLKGTISAGKYADFILIDRDIFGIEPQTIHGIRVLKTVMGGTVTWEE
jgi:predicted amidohydrolase YtcJ